MRFFGIGFLVLLFLEIMSIVWVADWLGGGWTLFLMAATFAAGVLMLRHTGLSGLLLAGAAVKSSGKVSVYQMLWPIRYTVAAVCLMSPGFVSSVLAVLLLPFKGGAVLQAGGAENFFNMNQSGRKEGFFHDDDIIEGEYTVEEPYGGNRSRNAIEHKKDE
ncbi:membrane protein FxsA [Neisseria gonorrhoeae]|uniref:FxsA family protein n=1 Tax=Neisseria gonorrhoeae TaxID=485 RepID=UPI000F4FD8C9|nr:FxsA family protein [Neisseria gonorrhoeae]ROV39809.1 membrane protein FxsA [Neisseria gonorrhoeae]